MQSFDLSITVMIYLIGMTLIGFYIMGSDKSRARKNEYRISEKTIWAVTMLGGAVGTYFGMRLFRHKTKHMSFKFGLPFFALVYLVILGAIWLK